MLKWFFELRGWYAQKKREAAQKKKAKTEKILLARQKRGELPKPEVESLAFNLGDRSIKVDNMVRGNQKFMVHKILGELTDIGAGKFARKALQIIERGFAEQGHLVFLVNETQGLLAKAEVERRLRNKYYFIGKKIIVLDNEPQTGYFVVFTN